MDLNGPEGPDYHQPFSLKGLARVGGEGGRVGQKAPSDMQTEAVLGQVGCVFYMKST